MKKSDIKIGESYAYANSDWSYNVFRATEVEILGEADVRSFGSRNTVKGWRVKSIATGKTFGATSRNIREPWDLYIGRRQEHLAYQRRREQEQHDEAVRAYARLKTISDAIEVAQPGRPTVDRVVYEEADHAREAGWTVLLDKDKHHGRPYIETALLYARNTGVDIRDVALLAETVLAFEGAISDPEAGL